MRRSRRPPVVLPPSDLTGGSGRPFSTAAAWNQPLGPELEPMPLLTRQLHLLGGIEVVIGPRVRHVFDAGRDVFIAERTPAGTVLRGHQGRLPPSSFVPIGETVLFDHKARTVLSARAWRPVADDGYTVDGLDVADLDGDGWGSPVVGLVLEQELLAGTIRHAIGLWAPTSELYGTWVRLAKVPPRLDPIETTIATALATYGGIVVGHNGTVNAPGPGLLVRVEASGAISPGDPVGPTYRQLGMGADSWPLRLYVEDFEVLV